MGLTEDFDDRQTQSEATTADYHAHSTYQSENKASWAGALPKKQGLYDPELEKDACGVGFACHIQGKASHKIVSDARNLLCNMTHRGAVGSDARDGDGAGVMTSIPHRFFVKNFGREQDMPLPAQGQYAVGNVFFKPSADTAQESKRQVEEIGESLGLRVLGWREVPVDSTLLGPAAKSREPTILQPFVVLESAYGDGKAGRFDEKLFERQLYVLRKRATHTIGLGNWFYICSLSNKNIVYKGQLAPAQVYQYYHDLANADYEAHFALVHSRFSTNTFPSWDRAQPLRWAAHNGEINTLRGNKNWMRAREGVMQSDVFGHELEQLYPIVEEGGSDSAAFDNVLELLAINGVLSLPEAVMLMVPEAWQGNTLMEPQKAAFYEWAACQMEAWDGPALFTFADGRFCGANLDRNGLRPCRFYTTTDDRIICASEVGTIAVEPDMVVQKGRLQPGRMLLVDTVAGRLIDDSELKAAVASRHDFRAWLDHELIVMPSLLESLRPSLSLVAEPDRLRLQEDPLLHAFGYTFEQVTSLLAPMASDEKEALGSMGNDAPLACLSPAPKLVYEYFRQLFAQVTNPPIDPIRESIVMSLDCYVGPQGNLLEMDASQCGRLLLPSPILSMAELEALKKMSSLHPAWTVKTIDLTFAKRAGVAGYVDHLDTICAEAAAAIQDGDRIIVLSDRATSADRVAVSAVLASGMVHQLLVSNKWRSMAALVVETAEAREVHHMTVLLGYGADAINPYLAMECILKLSREKLIRKPLSDEQLMRNYKHSCDGGILKVMSKMGISTLASYKGAQIFEALGIDGSVVERCFKGTASRIRGVTFELIAEDALRFHERGFPSRPRAGPLLGLAESGEYHWRDGGEAHINDPSAIANLQDAVRTKNDKSYEHYARIEYDKIKACTLRGMLDFKFEAGKAIAVEQVEPWTEIVRRFCTGAMSYGSISMESHSTLAMAMNRLGGKSNTGEGGEDPERSVRMAGGDSMRSAIKQVASGRFGVTSAYLADSDELQIKMAQGAKPGEGGELPGHKVSKSIARTRHSTPGVGLISPPPHHDIYSIEDLKQLIYDLKCASPRSRVSVKLVSETGVGIVASGVAKAKADHILISGHDGGTGASRWTGIKYAGLPWELGLAETHQTLVLNDLRGRVVVQTDGQLRTGRDVAMACLLGAEEWGFATTPLIALGCVFMRKCVGAEHAVRTSGGPKKISEVCVGHTLYNELDQPVQCVAVDDVKTGPLKKVIYRPFGAASDTATTSLVCTPDHILSLVATAVVPRARGRCLVWYTRCDRTKLPHAAAELAWEDVAAILDRPGTDGAEQGPRHYVDSILHAHFHQGHHEHGDPTNHALAKLCMRDLVGVDGPVDERHDDGDDDGDDDDQAEFGLVEPGGDTGTHVFDISLPLAASSLQPAAQTHADEARFACLQASLATGHCCRGFRRVQRRLATAEQASIARRLLAGAQYQLIDPFIVRPGDGFPMTPQEYQDMCCKQSKKTNIRLYQAPLLSEPTASSAGSGALPVDPYWLGFWLAGGAKCTSALISSDLEIKVFSHQYVQRLNATRPAGRKRVKVAECRQLDVVHLDIVTDASDDGVGYNPVRNGLASLGLWGDKSAGIPDLYRAADEQTRLQLIAGLIDSGGSYVETKAVYHFGLHGDEHQKMVDDLQLLCRSCGIDARGPFMMDTSTRKYHYIYLGNGSSKFQPYLCLPRKRMATRQSRIRKCHLRPILGIEDHADGPYRAIQVSGGVFQLEDRLVVHNCHLNTCPVGIATQDPELRKKFSGRPEHVINFFYYIANELRAIMAKLGFRTVNEMVGHAELLQMRPDLQTRKTANIDLSLILTPAHKLRPGVATFNVRKQDHRLHVRLDNKLIAEAELTLDKSIPSRIECDIVNTDRAMGTSLSYQISKRFGETGLPPDTVHVNIKGSAGQSFGAFLAPGVTLELEGDANDYVGKGLSGGRIIIYPPRAAVFKAEENVLVGNVCLYGATSGTCFLRGVAAERFAVRNSGATAVVEGVGDHGCEYMTGGRVAVLGCTGRNFAAGMSGGVAYVLDMHNDFESKLNMEMVEASRLEDADEIAFLRGLVEDHHHFTGSELAARILVDFNRALPRFVKVLPIDYKRVLEEEAVKAAEAKRTLFSLPVLANAEAAKKPGKQQARIQDMEDAVPDQSAAKKALTLDKTRGFMKYHRRSEKYRSAKTRTKDWAELSSRLDEDELKYQSARCMDCGVPFCQSDSGCPISNIIPNWNALVFVDQWKDALNRLIMTNNFPEFTGRVCPAPCEGACVLGINEEPVGIKSIECAIIDRGFEMGWMVPRPPEVRTGKKIAIIGSGPAGLACADQLNKAGHAVAVYERADRAGGLLMYGIPNMKLDKRVVQRRLDLMAAEGIVFTTALEIGKDVTLMHLQAQNDAVVLATGSTVPRDLSIKGRHLNGIHFAMEFLKYNTKSLLDSELNDNAYISAQGKNVVVIGGGDTGNDCIGTSLRHICKSVVNFELLPQPPQGRARDNPWPQWPRIYRTDYGHAEVRQHIGKDPREFCIMSEDFVDDGSGNVKGINTVRVEWSKDAGGGWKMNKVEGSQQFFPADLVLLSMGFVCPEDRVFAGKIELDARKNVKTHVGKFSTNIDGLFTAGDCHMGQSLVVRAIGEGRNCAREIDLWLMGYSNLPVVGGIVNHTADQIAKVAQTA